MSIDMDNMLMEIHTGCWARYDNIPYDNKREQLRDAIKYLTGEDYYKLDQNGKFILQNEELFNITGEQIANYPQCLCSCNECKDQYVVKYMPTGIEFCVGSVCIRNFRSKRLNSQLAYTIKNNRCSLCNSFLVFRKNNAGYAINTKKNHRICSMCEYC